MDQTTDASGGDRKRIAVEVNSKPEPKPVPKTVTVLLYTDSDAGLPSPQQIQAALALPVNVTEMSDLVETSRPLLMENKLVRRALMLKAATGTKAGEKLQELLLQQPPGQVLLYKLVNGCQGGTPLEAVPFVRFQTGTLLLSLKDGSWDPLIPAPYFNEIKALLDTALAPRCGVPFDATLVKHPVRGGDCLRLCFADADALVVLAKSIRKQTLDWTKALSAEVSLENFPSSCTLVGKALLVVLQNAELAFKASDASSIAFSFLPPIEGTKEYIAAWLFESGDEKKKAEHVVNDLGIKSLTLSEVQQILHPPAPQAVAIEPEAVRGAQARGRPRGGRGQTRARGFTPRGRR